MSTLQIILALNILLQVVLFFASIADLRKRQGPFKEKIILYLYPFGAFVWEDMLPLSILWAIVSAILFYFNSWKYAFVVILLFVIFRWFGEMVYWFFEQFDPNHLRPFDFGLGNLSNKSVYIICQVFAIAIVTLASFLLYIVVTTP